MGFSYPSWVKQQLLEISCLPSMLYHASWNNPPLDIFKASEQGLWARFGLSGLPWRAESNGTTSAGLVATGAARH